MSSALSPVSRPSTRTPKPVSPTRLSKRTSRSIASSHPSRVPTLPSLPLLTTLRPPVRPDDTRSSACRSNRTTTTRLCTSRRHRQSRSVDARTNRRARWAMSSSWTRGHERFGRGHAVGEILQFLNLWWSLGVAGCSRDHVISSFTSQALFCPATLANCRRLDMQA